VFLRAEGRKALFIPLITLCKQASYSVNVMSAALGISISIFTVGGLRDVPSKDY